MTSAQGEAGASTPRSNWPRWLHFVIMACFTVIAVLGLYFVENFFTNFYLRTIGYCVFVVLGAGSIGLILLRFDEWRQLHRWQQWKCPQCGEKYRIRQFSDVKFWAKERTGRRAGVLLRCAECDVESAFENSGHLHRR